MFARDERFRPILSRIVLGTALALGASAALAMGSGSTSEPDCPKGQIKDADGKCKPASNNAIDQNARVEYGLALAKAERYEEAISVLKPAVELGDKRALNYTGYSLRKSGHVDEGIAFYMKALAADPNYVQAREYLGEAYLTLGRLDLAEEQLKEIEVRCNANCETYLDFSDRIEYFRERASRG